MRLKLCVSPLILGAAIAGGCSTTDNPLLSRPQSVAWNTDFAVPSAVRAPAGHLLLGHVVGRGVATYTLQPDPSDPNRNVWALVRDEGGDLLDENGRVVGHHEGNSWAVRDGSRVTAEPTARVPQQYAVPGALYRATAHEGNGLLGGATFIEQLHMIGGPPVTEKPYVAAGSEYRAEYSADYYFYGPAVRDRHLD